MTQSITSRRSSYYTNSLNIYDDPDNVIGNYTCVVGNSHGKATSDIISIQGDLHAG